ncbi:MAG: YceG family protein [Oscillospiraceae bacterium]
MVNFGNKFANNNNNIPKPESPEIPQENNIHSDGFTRYAGYDDAQKFTEFLTNLYTDTQSDGIFIDKPIPNPSSPEVNSISNLIDVSAELTDEFIKQSVVKCSGSLIDFSKIGSGKSPQQAADIFCSVIDDLRRKNSASNVIKNSFIKFICWSARFSTFRLTNILYTGDISHYEVCWLYIMHRLGCKVTYVSPTGDEAYLKADPSSEYSTLKAGKNTAPLNFSFRSINLETVRNNKKMENMLSASSGLEIDTSTPILRDNIESEFLKPYNQRTISYGSCFDNGKFTVYFAAMIGYSEDTQYRNFLYNIRENILNKTKKALVFTERFNRPTYDEGAAFLSVNRTDMQIMIASLAEKIDIKNCPSRTVLARKNFIDILKKRASGETNIQRIFNLGVSMIIWLRLCTEQTDFKDDIPLLLYYGNATPHELIFMKLLCLIGFDVIYTTPDKSVLDTVKAENDGIIQIIEEPLSCPVFPYPDKPVRTKFATEAYNAERELDTLLYNDGNLFRNRQFATCRSITLKTTYEEIEILWKQESKYRSGFSSAPDIVTVPTIFTKISGTGENISQYWADVAAKITGSSLLYTNVPFFNPVGDDNYNGYFKADSIDIPKLMQSRYNKYNYLNDSIQQFIFSKMQEVIDCGYIRLPQPDIMHLVIKTGLGLGQDIIRIIQNYDFTKEVPKIIIVDNVTQTFNVYECIYLVLLNLMGFDIIIYTPTGYKNIENYVNPQAYEVYTMPCFRDNLHIPNLKTIKPPKENGGFFGGLFRRH